MSAGWKNYEPAPLEFFHEELFNEFHRYRVSKTDSTSVAIDGTILSNMIARAKKTTYKKYKGVVSEKPIPKSQLNSDDDDSIGLGVQFPTY